ncbi:MAG: acetoacetate decarboxylase family protein [Leptolyngbyaceae cyanobacterium bins.59]|nr:acetoacetate decarboxylase family protein [Leptolyngbyaceae cyanobacterium bins.59]
MTTKHVPMSYPSAPWSLQGFALLTLHPISVEQARSHVPPSLQIFEVWPGYTLGGVYLATYESGSTLQYNELIVVAALARHSSNHWGACISHIYVDNPDSVEGGREIWGLPKELAHFSWQQGDRPSITVKQDEQLLCCLTYQNSFNLWRQSFTGFAFGQHLAQLLWFSAKAIVNPGFSQATLEIPSTSPFGPLNLGNPWLTTYLQGLDLTVEAPQVVG